MSSLRKAGAMGWIAAALLSCSDVDNRNPELALTPEFPSAGAGGAGTPAGAGGTPSVGVSELQPGPGGAAGASTGGRVAEIPEVRPVDPIDLPEPVGPLLRLGALQLEFGGIVLGASATLGISVENAGDEPLAYVATIRGAGAPAFSIAEDCPNPLEAGASCILGIRFSPATLGEFLTELALTPEGGAPAVVVLRASALAPGALVGNQAFVDFGAIEASAARDTFTWTVTNGGGVPTGSLSLFSSPAAPFAIDQNDCLAPLAPGASCDLIVSFSPGAGGPFSGNILLTDASSSVGLSLSGRGVHRLSIDRVGTGSISSSPAGLSCAGNSCTGLFDPGVVIVTARTNNGSGNFFSGWSQGDCFASQRCELELRQSRQLTATFLQQTNNLIFTSSTLLPTDLGGLAAYDAECNRLATAAGINDTGGNAFVAAMSASNSSLRQRLAGARGWVRMDGRPFGDTLAAIFDNKAVHYAAAFDEQGVMTPSVQNFFSGGLGFDPFTGTRPDGSASPDNCNNWTTTSADVFTEIARASGGPSSWISEFAASCGGISPERLVCMGRTRSAAISVPRFTGKRMWTVFGYTPGSMTPDQKCQGERPTGVATARAFITYSNRTAATVLDPAATYVRPDGTLVGLGSDIARWLPVGIPWLDATGAFNPIPQLVWTGGGPPDSIEFSGGYHCDDWRSGSNALRGQIANYGIGSPRWFDTGGIVTCDTAGGLYCVEQ